MKKIITIILIIFSLLLINVYPFDCKYYSFEFSKNQKVTVNDQGVYVEDSEGKVTVDDSGVKVIQNEWKLIDNRDTTKKDGLYTVFFQHNTYKFNVKVNFYLNNNIFYNDYNEFISKIKSNYSNVQISKSTIPNDSNRIVYKIVIVNNQYKTVYYTISSDFGFYTIEFSGKKEYFNNLASDLKNVIDTFIPKY
ncbi:MAG: hypothetical protein ACP5RD_05520 [bacterium]|jgi:hypothetical protein